MVGVFCTYDTFHIKIRNDSSEQVCVCVCVVCVVCVVCGVCVCVRMLVETKNGSIGARSVA